MPVTHESGRSTYMTPETQRDRDLGSNRSHSVLVALDTGFRHVTLLNTIHTNKI